MKKVLPYSEIELQLQQLGVGEVFENTYFKVAPQQMTTLAKFLSRKVAEGLLMRLTKGKYYKPNKTIFGILAPVSQQVIKSVTQKKGQTIGYITGIKAYQEKRLTTQLPNIIEIAIHGKPKSYQKIGAYQFRFITRKFAFTPEQVPLLQWLDALKDIKRIPDTSISETIHVIKAILTKMPLDEVTIMIELAQHYPPFVKALLGAIVQEAQPHISLIPLLRGLNPLSIYKIGLKANDLNYQKKWKIR